MIPERNTVQVQSTIEGDAISMSVDQSALQHIMNVLTDIYADPELAVIREYATNALDSHVQAGQSRPIEVTTPTPLSPTFKVRDYGTGADLQDIEDWFSTYGASSKRGSNDAVGMLGIGCKSALAYVDQFTITGIKNGRKITVSAARDETGAGVMTVVENVPTTEPQGVEVQVPARRDNELSDKAESFFRFWDEGTVLLNGQAPPKLEGYELSGGEFVLEDTGARSWRGRHGTGRLTVVMGNVPYPAPDGFQHG